MSNVPNAPSMNSIRKSGIVLFFCAVFFVYAQGVSAAEILVSPSTGTYSAGQSLTSAIRVNPGGKSINAVETTLTFDISKLAVVSVSKTGSVFSLWTTEPTFSNSAGTIQFGGGSPTPFSSQSTLITVTFRAVAAGSVTVDVKTASVLAADGQGTDVYSGAQKATYTISAAAATPPPKPDTPPVTTPPADTSAADNGNAAITFGDAPLAPEIASKVFADADKWYATSTGLFTWELPFDVNLMTADVATSAEAVPHTEYKPPVGELLLGSASLHDGVQFLTVRFKNQVGWGATAHRKVMIDTTAPENFTINVRAGNAPTAFPTLVFAANDQTSGIDHYELTISDKEPVIVTPDEAKLGYLLGELVNGTYTVKVTAFDKAGNSTVSNSPILITSGWEPKKDEAKKSSFWALLSFTTIFMTLLIFLILALVFYIYYERKQFSRKETRLRKEAKEIQDQMEKIFSALRDEIHDQIQAINKKPRLSREEKAAIESLENALEVSETLIEKEIVDVQKILK